MIQDYMQHRMTKTTDYNSMGFKTSQEKCKGCSKWVMKDLDRIAEF